MGTDKLMMPQVNVDDISHFRFLDLMGKLHTYRFSCLFKIRVAVFLLSFLVDEMVIVLPQVLEEVLFLKIRLAADSASEVEVLLQGDCLLTLGLCLIALPILLFVGRVGVGRLHDKGVDIDIVGILPGTVRLIVNVGEV